MAISFDFIRLTLGKMDWYGEGKCKEKIKDKKNVLLISYFPFSKNNQTINITNNTSNIYLGIYLHITG